jgi:hypothetical protein
LQGKIVHGGTFNGNEEEGKKEETLTVGETLPRIHHGFSLASREKHLLGGFPVLSAKSGAAGPNQFWACAKF